MKKESFQELNLPHGFLFSRVMANPELCRMLLEKILQVSIKGVALPELQKWLKGLLW